MASIRKTILGKKKLKDIDNLYLVLETNVKEILFQGANFQFPKLQKCKHFRLCSVGIHKSCFLCIFSILFYALPFKNNYIKSHITALSNL